MYCIELEKHELYPAANNSSGFVLVELASHVITFHKGYDLYNVGFAGGILSFAYFSIFKLLKKFQSKINTKEIEPKNQPIINRFKRTVKFY